ncbi:MAG: protein kinase, partial [Myxococcota bacterium]
MGGRPGFRPGAFRRNTLSERDSTADDGGESGIFSPGDVAGGRFRILRVVGRGAMAVVYLAEDTVLGGPPVALKMMSRHIARHPAARELFRREVVSARAVAHPNVVRVFDYHLVGDVPAITMEYLKGGTLLERLRSQKAIPMADRLMLLADIAEGLHAAHSAGVIHRDLKPENVLFSDDGKPKLTDFGIARPASTTQETAPRFSALYAAPEQIKGEKPTAQTDIYSFGVMAFHVLCGQPPFVGGGMSVLEAHVRQPAPNPASVNSAIPGAASALVLQCLEKEAARRPANAQDIARGLRASATSVESQRDASVLFIDLVAYSVQATSWQGDALMQLTRFVSECNAVTSVPQHQLVKLPTGDGAALVFLSSPQDAFRAAIQIGAALKQADLQARLGLHHGSIMMVADVNSQRNVAGSGINMCQRVMSCGGGGHIIASDQFRAELLKTEPESEGMFNGPYHAIAKHGVKLLIWNVYSTGVVGNPDDPPHLEPEATNPFGYKAFVPPDGAAAPGRTSSSGGTPALRVPTSPALQQAPAGPVDDEPWPPPRSGTWKAVVAGAGAATVVLAIAVGLLRGGSTPGPTTPVLHDVNPPTQVAQGPTETPKPKPAPTPEAPTSSTSTAPPTERKEEPRAARKEKE